VLRHPPTNVDQIVVSTVVYLPPDEVYDFLADFSRYPKYSEYLKHVHQRGDGGAGTRYDMRFAWWKLTYTLRSEVTDVDPPWRIDWRIVKDLNAHGDWRVEELDDLPDNAPADAETACRVTLDVSFDPQTARDGAVDLPRFVSFDFVVDKIKPVLVKEAQKVVERIVADIEGRRREVELVVERQPS
jgi:ribosome-associated toxin RatA of RatAB toxin-antitoxin module